MKFRLATMPGQGGAAQGIGQGFAALGMLPAMRAQAAEEAQNAQMKRDLMGAQLRQSDAHAALFGAQADAERTQLNRGSLPELLKSAALQNGVPLSKLDEATDYFQSGQLAGRYDLPAGQAGPTLPAPQYADPDLGRKLWQTIGLTQQALAVGDKDVSHISAAAGNYQQQGLTGEAAQLARTGADDMTLGRMNAVLGKKEFTPFAAVGTTGTALNQVTGDQQVANQALNVLFGQGERAQINQRNAAAGASNASAANSRASAAKTMQELEQGVRTGDLQVVTGQDGAITVVNKRTLSAQPVLDAQGRPVIKGSTGGGGKPMTEGQAKANLFGGRMVEAGKLLDDLEAKGVFERGRIKRTAEGFGMAVPLIGDEVAAGMGHLTNWTQSPEQQMAEQAQRDFVNAVLRRESGAVINPDEFTNAAMQYFPQPGDSPKVIEQKRRNRKVATTLMLQEVPEAQRYRLGAATGGATATPTAQPVGAEPDHGFGKRADGTNKGTGFLGVLNRPDGSVSTEISIGVNLGGREVEIPTLVPTLAPQEVQHLLAGGKPTPAIVDKAVAFARQRMAQGKSPFAQPGEGPKQGGATGSWGPPAPAGWSIQRIN